MVQKLKNKKYKVQLRVGGRIVTHTFDNKADAEEKEAELKRTQKLIRAGMEAPKDSELYMDYGPAWLRKQEREGMPLSTLKAYARNMKNYTMGRLGPYLLSQISSDMLQRLLDDAQAEPWKFVPGTSEPLSNATRNRIRALLSTLFQSAFREGKVVTNPVLRVPKLDERKTQRRSITPLSPEEAEAFVAGGYALSAQDGFLAVLFILTGGRNSQIAGLQVGDFDLVRNELGFFRIYEDESCKIVPRIKGRPDGIVIPLFPLVRDAFERHLRETPFTKPGDFCLTTPVGKNLSTDAIARRVTRICEHAGIRPITPHVLRATFATHGEEAGFSKEDLQRLLGHSSVLVTERYTRRGAQPLLEKGKKIGFGASPEPKEGKE